ncbi:hypothetical protein E4U30_000075, partial [Claviceps sp. LM220 group G6]
SPLRTRRNVLYGLTTIYFQRAGGVVQIDQPLRRHNIPDCCNPDHDACDKSHHPVL